VQNPPNRRYGSRENATQNLNDPSRGPQGDQAAVSAQPNT